jgi:phosphatidylserine decarboxylase
LYTKLYFIYLGYFAYGGSTIVIVFKAGMVKWDEDLRHNSNNSMETLVRMGEHIGQRTSEEQRLEYLSHTPSSNKNNATISQLISYFPATDSVK